jgi:hypothetical protein
MCLSLNEWRALRGIGRQVCRSDPQLASLLAIFSRLSAAEAMPGHERMRHGADRILARLALAVTAATRTVVRVIARPARALRALRAARLAARPTSRTRHTAGPRRRSWIDTRTPAYKPHL